MPPLDLASNGGCGSEIRVLVHDETSDARDGHHAAELRRFHPVDEPAAHDLLGVLGGRNDHARLELEAVALGLELAGQEADAVEADALGAAVGVVATSDEEGRVGVGRLTVQQEDAIAVGGADLLEGFTRGRLEVRLARVHEAARQVPHRLLGHERPGLLHQADHDATLGVDEVRHEDRTTTAHLLEAPGVVAPEGTPTDHPELEVLELDFVRRDFHSVDTELPTRRGTLSECLQQISNHSNLAFSLSDLPSKQSENRIVQTSLPLAFARRRVHHVCGKRVHINDLACDNSLKEIADGNQLERTEILGSFFELGHIQFDLDDRDCNPVSAGALIFGQTQGAALTTQKLSLTLNFTLDSRKAIPELALDQTLRNYHGRQILFRLRDESSGKKERRYSDESPVRLDHQKVRSVHHGNHDVAGQSFARVGAIELAPILSSLTSPRLQKDETDRDLELPMSKDRNDIVNLPISLAEIPQTRQVERNTEAS
ncbi:MAG: hypothetical protein UT32_C0001G0082 [Parcubacteria group bacterium GW2011_GWC2_39_14]|nr:MAG: hypothetical protein UT32_C0001G0082 [Parcubacteria group bacterium GW2011_GWC2_39_14]KKR55506.1 MAG: hypothetical protein UT91_C0001G0081 [Parcubacteria group bacterium GW2011_GWA2_40_23]